DGRPGVRSARYAGEHASDTDNLVALLDELDRLGVEPGARTARFRTAIVLRLADGSELLAEGSVEGTILVAPRGDGGFGYDPVFVPLEGDGRTFAEMAPGEKH